MKKKIILGITGIRSEYDIMSSVFTAIQNHNELELKLIVLGAHLSMTYGHTVDMIRKDGFNVVEEIESLLNADTDSSRVKGLGIQLQSLAQSIARIRPDILLVLGDREEALSTAIAGAYMNIPVAHIAGGDRVVGNVDDQVRHAVTKLAHIHFVTNKESYERIVKLGEQPFRIHNVGNPGLDRLLKVEEMSIETLSQKLGFTLDKNKPFILLIQHPLSSEYEKSYEQMKETLEAIKEIGISTVLSYPNSDAGSQQIIRAIENYRSLPNLYISKNIPRLEFVNLFRKASCILGNSSSGIMEAPLFHKPVVNVGSRQQGRLQAGNVQFTECKKNAIIDAVKRAIFNKEYIQSLRSLQNPYGDGNSSQRICEILAKTTIDQKLLIKDITY